MAEPAADRLTLANQPRTEGPFRLKGAHRRASDAACAFEVLDDFERFNQANDIYSRAQWDERIRSKNRQILVPMNPDHLPPGLRELAIKRAESAQK